MGFPLELIMTFDEIFQVKSCCIHYLQPLQGTREGNPVFLALNFILIRCKMFAITSIWTKIWFIKIGLHFLVSRRGLSRFDDLASRLGWKSFGRNLIGCCRYISSIFKWTLLIFVADWWWSYLSATDTELVASAECLFMRKIDTAKSDLRSKYVTDARTALALDALRALLHQQYK